MAEPKPKSRFCLCSVFNLSHCLQANSDNRSQRGLRVGGRGLGGELTWDRVMPPFMLRSMRGLTASPAALSWSPCHPSHTSAQHSTAQHGTAQQCSSEIHIIIVHLIIRHADSTAALARAQQQALLCTPPCSFITMTCFSDWQGSARCSTGIRHNVSNPCAQACCL